jgi:ABC-type multidrug transport system fused ATPase/permease subunit
LGRIRATGKLLLTAAVIMSCMLLLSSFVATLLIPESDYRLGGPASGRALAYLAHGLLGNDFGAVYDLSTILILWFAGASAMTGLLNLIPRYLPRFGMAPRWVAYRRPLVLVLLAINVAVTLAFRAQVEAQAGAYATGVLVLMFSGAAGVALDLWRESSLHKPQTMLVALYFFVITFVFAYTLGANIVERPDGLIVATIFIILLLAASAISRYARSTEMRVSTASFADQQSAELWNTIAGKKVNLIPDRTPTADYRALIAEKVQRHFKIEGPLAFIHVTLLDNRSDFVARLRVQVRQERKHYVIDVGGAVAVANSIAYLSELLDPVSIVLGLTHRNLMKQSLAYLIWGEGETGLMCYSILVRRWEVTKPMLGRPLIFLISE